MNKAESYLKGKTRGIAKKAGDVRLNNSGTVGTEPIMKNGKIRTEVNLGKLGSVRLPSARDIIGAKKTAEKKLQNAGATIRKNATSFAKDVKKTGFHPMNDKGIIGTVNKRAKR